MFLLDERLIVVDQKVSPLLLDDKKRLRDVGIKTILAEGFASWQDISSTPYTFNPKLLERYVEGSRRAGLKTLIAMYAQVPKWVPGSYLTWDQDRQWGAAEAVLDPFDLDGFEEELEFLEAVADHFDAIDICCYYSMPSSGERLLPRGLGGCTQAEAIEIAKARQTVFANHSNDLWTCFHPAINDGVGNEHIDAVHKALLREFPVHTHHRILWTFFTHPDTQWELNHDRYWVGAEYAVNVAKNAQLIGDWRAYGLIMAPTRWQDGPVVVTDKEITEIEKALEILGGY